MNFDSLSTIKKNGFEGFVKIKDLLLNTSMIPKSRGVYLILYTGTTSPTFLSTGTGGYFKGKNPNISINELQTNWVSDSMVVYIGKAGGLTGKATLHSRLNQYLKFGQGKNIGHWGGRLIWQLKNSHDLQICWKPITTMEPRDCERELIQSFKQVYGKLPFANLSE